MSESKAQEGQVKQPQTLTDTIRIEVTTSIISKNRNNILLKPKMFRVKHTTR